MPKNKECWYNERNYNIFANFMENTIAFRFIRNYSNGNGRNLKKFKKKNYSLLYQIKP